MRQYKKHLMNKSNYIPVKVDPNVLISTDNDQKQLEQKQNNNAVHQAKDPNRSTSRNKVNISIQSFYDRKQSNNSNNVDVNIERRQMQQVYSPKVNVSGQQIEQKLKKLDDSIAQQSLLFRINIQKQNSIKESGQKSPFKNEALIKNENQIKEDKKKVRIPSKTNSPISTQECNESPKFGPRTEHSPIFSPKKKFALQMSITESQEKLDSPKEHKQQQPVKKIDNIVIKQSEPTTADIPPEDASNKTQQKDPSTQKNVEEKPAQNIEDIRASFHQYELLNMIVQNQEIQIQDMKNRNANFFHAQQYSYLQPIQNFGQPRISTRSSKQRYLDLLKYKTVTSANNPKYVPDPNISNSQNLRLQKIPSSVQKMKLSNARKIKADQQINNDEIRPVSRGSNFRYMSRRQNRQAKPQSINYTNFNRKTQTSLEKNTSILSPSQKFQKVQLLKRMYNFSPMESDFQKRPDGRTIMVNSQSRASPVSTMVHSPKQSVTSKLKELSLNMQKQTEQDANLQLLERSIHQRQLEDGDFISYLSSTSQVQGRKDSYDKYATSKQWV